MHADVEDVPDQAVANVSPPSEGASMHASGIGMHPPRARTHIVKRWKQDNCYNSALEFDCFDFCFGFQSKIFDQNMPLLEGPIIP